MNPFLTLRNIVFWLAARALRVHDAVSRIPLVGNIFGTFFYNVSEWLFDLGSPLGHLAAWYESVIERISRWLTSLDVLSIMSQWIARVNQLWAWFGSWWLNVQTAISTWWQGIGTDVLAWVQSARDYAFSLIVGVRQQLDRLTSSWDNFRTAILPSLALKGEVSTLITSAFTPWVKTFNIIDTFGKDIVDFFNNPLNWLLDHFTDWFIGKE